MGMSDKCIAVLCKEHYDNTMYGMRYDAMDISVDELDMTLYNSWRTVARLRQTWNLQKARKQNHTLESIHDLMVALKAKYPMRGASNLRHALRVDHGVWASK